METELCAVAPADWEIRSVEDVCYRVTSGGTPSRRESAYYAGGTWPWVKTQELQDKWIDDTEEHITEEAIASSSAKVLPAHTVLVAMYGATVGQLGILRRPMTCNQACSALIVNPAESDYRFLYFQLLQVRSQLKSLATGAAQQNLSGVLIKSLRLPFPPLDEQRAIAHILGTLDDKIELNRRMNETLEGMARALFKSWFVDFDPVRAKAEGRDPGLPKPIAYLFPDSFEDSELGEIPKGWEVGTIKDCCTLIQNGGTPRRDQSNYWEGGRIPWLTSGEVRQPIVTRTSNFITEAGLEESSARWIPAFSTVVALYGATAGQVSLVSLPLTTNQAVCALLPRQNLEFYNYLRMRAVVSDLENKAVGSAQQNISKAIVEETLAIIPSDTMSKCFDGLVRPIFNRWISCNNENYTLTALRDTLLPKLISGDLRVKDADRFAARKI